MDRDRGGLPPPHGRAPSGRGRRDPERVGRARPGHRRRLLPGGGNDAERRADSSQWTLVFSFRPVDAGQGSLWAAYPLTSSSKAALFAQAEKLSNDTLAALLAERLE